jgi:uncharacterized protein YkwD
MPTRRSARHRAGPRRAGNPDRASARRFRYLLCGLVLLPVLTAGGFYLARGSSPAPSPVPGRVTALQTPPATCAPASGTPASGAPASGTPADAPASGTPAGAPASGVPASDIPAAYGLCTGRPFHAAVASVPPSASANLGVHPAKRPAARLTPTASASFTPATPSPTASAVHSPGTSPGTAAAQVLALINQNRSAAGLSPLTITAGLDSSASAHNLMMAGGCGLSHQCPAEPDLGARETAAGVVWSACGENIGEGGPVANTSAAIAQMAVSLTQDMLNEKPPDDGYRRNILSSSYTHIGIAIHRDSSGTVWLTQDFSN